MTTEATVTNLNNERLIREGEAAVVLYTRGLDEARANIMPMARGLWAARHEYPANIPFGAWLAQSPYSEIGQTDRAALIHIGEHERVAAAFIRTTRLTSPESIWEMLAPIIAAASSEPSENVLPPPPLPQPSPPSAPVAKTDEPTKNNSVPTPAPITPRSAFFTAPRAEEIATMFQSKDTRSTLSHVWEGRGNKQVWELIITALDAGLIAPNNRAIEKPNLGLLFPSAPSAFVRQYDLTNQKQRTHIREVLLPKMIACRDKLLAEPDRLREILNEYDKEHHVQQRQAVVAEKRAVAVKALPMAEQELVMFGQMVWPRLDISQGDYDYDQVRAAIWTFRDYEGWNMMIKDSDVGSHARRIRNSLRYLGEYLLRTDRNNPMAKILSLIAWFSYLMEKNPTGECKWPMYPHIEGQW